MPTYKDLLTAIPKLSEIDEVARIEYMNEVGLLIEKYTNREHLKEKYKEILQELEGYDKDIQELENRLFPVVYLGQAKHHSTKQPYIVGRTAWKKGVNDYIHLRVHLGSVTKYKLGIEDPEVKRLATQKMREKIKQILPPIE